MPIVRIAPSILSADFSRLGEQVEEAIRSGADMIHVDVMDGHFVPNLTMGPMIVSAIKPICSAAGVPIDVHLMVERPEALIESFVHAGSDILTVHVETCPHLNRTVQQIHELGNQAGVSLNPATALSSLEEVLPYVDLVLVMTVNPGFGGQRYLAGSTQKISRLRQMLDDRSLSRVAIEVDGGISESNVGEVVEAGATILVAGSAIFNRQASIAENLSRIRQAIVKD